MALYRNIGALPRPASVGAAGPPYGSYVFLRNINGLYVDSQQGQTYMTCDNNNPGLYEAFLVLDGGGVVCFLASNGKFVTRQDAEGTPMICNRDQALGWQRFGWITNGDGTFSLQGDNGLFVSSENGQAPMTCNRSSIGGWEEFRYELLPSDYKFDWIFGSGPNPVTVQDALSYIAPAPAPTLTIPEAPLPIPTTPTLTTITPVTSTPATGIPLPVTTPLPPAQSANWVGAAVLGGSFLIALTGDRFVHHRPKLIFAGGMGLLYYLLNSQKVNT